MRVPELLERTCSKKTVEAFVYDRSRNLEPQRSRRQSAVHR